MQNDLEKLLIIKEKIVKTDQVLKILLERKNELAKQEAKYQSLLTQYSNKCKELERAIKESNNVSLEYRRIRSEIQSLQAKLSTSIASYESLESKYYNYVNSTELKLQTVNLELQTSEKKCEEQAKSILKLEKRICDLKLKAKEQGSPKKARKKEGQNDEVGKLLATNAEIKLRLNSALQSDAKKSKKIDDLERELMKLQDEIKMIKTSNNESNSQCIKEDKQGNEEYELRITNLIKQTKSLESDNRSLKTKIQDVESNNHHLKEQITELQFELNVLNSEFNDKQLINVFTQTDDSSEQNDFEIDFMLHEMMLPLPRLVSPFEISSGDDIADENIYKKHNTSYNNENFIPPLILPANPQTIPEITITPPTPISTNFANLAIAKDNCKTVAEGNIFMTKQASSDQIIINNSKVNIVYSSEPISTKISANDSAQENKLLTLQMKSCYHSECIKYHSKVQIGDSNEFELLGFEPVNAENKDRDRFIEMVQNTDEYVKNTERVIENHSEKSVNKREERIVKRLPNRKVNIRKCSDLLYKRLLNDLHSMLSKNTNISSRTRTDERFKYHSMLRKTRVRKRQSKHKNRWQDAERNKYCDRRSLENNEIDINYADNIYEIEQKSVDSGYSAHIASESEFSENTSVKNGIQNVRDRSDATIKRKSGRDTQIDESKKMKLDLFGSDSSSEDENIEKSEVRKKAVARKPSLRQKLQNIIQRQTYGKMRIKAAESSKPPRRKPQSLPKNSKEPIVEKTEETKTSKEIPGIFKKPAIENLQKLAENLSKASDKNLPKSIVEDLQRTMMTNLQKPVVENRQHFEAIKNVLQTPVVENRQHFEAIKNILQTPVVENRQHFEAIKNVLQTPVVENRQHFEAIKNILQTPVVENRQHLETIQNIVGIDTESKNEPVKDAHIEKPPEVKTFKRPTCRRRVPDAPRSPEPEETQKIPPKIIPLSKPKRLAKLTAKNLFNKLLNFPEEEAVLQEVSSLFGAQEPEYIAGLIVRRVSQDFNDTPDMKFTPPAPIMTQTQRTLLGLLARLESQTEGIVSHFLVQCERAILSEKRLECVSPLTRLYLAVTKVWGDIHRMRRTCLDALYYMGDLVVPFLYVVITCWGEVIPKSSENGDTLLMKVLVQIVNIKDCNKPGYNLMNLRMILSQVYGYPDLDKRWNSDEMFADIFAQFRGNPTSKEAQLAVLIMCKNHSVLWTYNQIEKHLKPVLMSSAEDPNLKLSVINLVDRIAKCFNKKDDGLILGKINQFLEGCKIQEER